MAAMRSTDAKSFARGFTVLLGACAILIAALLMCLAPQARAASGFSDVPSNAWYVQGGYLDYVVGNGIMTGTKDPVTQLPSGKFEPEGSITRGQVATVLYRVANPDSTATTVPSDYAKRSSFSDVKAPYYYTAAIEWCYEQGIVTGYKDPVTQASTGKFGPEDPVTREQLATMLYRFAQESLGQTDNVSAAQGFDAMPDAGRVQPFATDSMRWCYAQGILTGSILPEGTYLLPRGEATRAQMAKMVTVLLTGNSDKPGPVYEPVEVALKARLGTSSVDTAFVTDGRFNFEVKDAAGRTVSKGVNHTTGDITFSPIAHAEPGTYRYTVIQVQGERPGWTLDSQEATVEVVVSARGNKLVAEVSYPTGDIMFINNYTDPAYVLLYEDGTLVFQRGDSIDASRGALVEKWTGPEMWVWDNDLPAPWYSHAASVTRVVVADVVQPISTANWFFGMTNCTSMDLEKIDLSLVYTMERMFGNCESLEKLDVRDWDVSSVTNMSLMFCGCRSLGELDVSAWDTSSVTDMSMMFDSCLSLARLDVARWDTSRVQNMAYMFNGSAFLGERNVFEELNVSQWDVSEVKSMEAMFSGCAALTSLDLSAWNTSQVEDMSFMFNCCDALVELDLSGLDVGSVANMQAMFQGCSSLRRVIGTGWDTSSVTDMSFMFYLCPSLEVIEGTLDTSSATTMSNMFGCCSALISLDVSGWDLSNVTDLRAAFSECAALESLDVSVWDVSRVTDMYNLFSGCRSLKVL